MTALKKYQKLESSGLWRETAQGQRREVIVNLGHNSLIFSDPRQDLPLSHWSLPAVIRLNPGEMPALYAPGSGEEESLELDDDDMIAALDTVQRALRNAQPHPGRLRQGLKYGLLGLVALLIIGPLPPALIGHTAHMLPQAKEAEIGEMVLEELTTLTGPACNATLGSRALNKLAQRLATPAPRLVVLPEGLPHALGLPGDIIALPQALLGKQDGPELLAGVVLAQLEAASQHDPLAALLDYAGMIPTIKLLTTGDLAQGAISGYAAELISTPPATLKPEPLLARFASANVSSIPYAHFADPAGTAMPSLISNDPLAHNPQAPLIGDQDWVSLQDICAG